MTTFVPHLKLSQQERTEALEFSRLYDNLLWVVTSLLTTANAALFAIAADKVTPEIALLGIGLSVLTVFFAASFRLLRLRLHEKLEKEDVSSRWLYGGLATLPGQWVVYVLFYAGLCGLWTSLRIRNGSEHPWVWWATLVTALGSILWLYVISIRHTLGDKAGT